MNWNVAIFLLVGLLGFFVESNTEAIINHISDTCNVEINNT